MSTEGRSVGALPAPPDDVVEAARRAFLQRRAGVEPADLVFDSLLDGYATPTDSPRFVMFSGRGFAILLAITRTRKGCNIAGTTFAPGHSLALSITRPIGEDHVLLSADGHLVATITPGIVSLVARSEVDGRAWRCDWLRL